MHTVSIKQLKQVLEHVVMGLKEPVMIVGPSGCGKTAGIDQFGQEDECVVHHVLLGQYDTVDVKGTPWVTDLVGDETADAFKATVWHPASTLPFKGNPRFSSRHPIILFLDEITSATVPVLGICYQLVHENRIGEHELMDNVHIVCAGNRESDKGIVNRMPMPLCNRMTWFEIGIDVEQWCKWASETYNSAADIFIAFMNFRKVLIHTFDPLKPEKVFATPRTWEKCIRYFASNMPEDIKMASIAGAVGSGPAAEFWGFVDAWQRIVQLMPSVLKNPAKATVPNEPSLQYAMSVAISGNMTAKTVKTYHTYLLRMPPEFTVLAWTMAVKRDADLFNAPEFLDFCDKFKVIWN